MFDQRRACLKSSYIWPLLSTFQLHDNLRLKSVKGYSRLEGEEYANWLLRLGNGELHSGNTGTIALSSIDVDFIPPFTSCPHAILDWIYDGFIDRILKKDWTDLVKYYGERCLITPLNVTVREINTAILSRIPGDPFMSVSINEADDQYEDPMSIDVLNEFESNGFPTHRLFLKVGQAIMVIRNLSIAQGICNGTRLIIVKITSHLLKCIVVNGNRAGAVVGLPRVKLFHKGDRDFPIPFSRIQFPVVSAFCLTINKAQGQSLDKVAVLLSGPVFAHGQLYVALSRCTRLDRLKVGLFTNHSEPITTNVVCKEVLSK